MRKYVANGHAVRRHVFDGKVMPGNSTPVSEKRKEIRLNMEGRKGQRKEEPSVWSMYDMYYTLVNSSNYSTYIS